MSDDEKVRAAFERVVAEMKRSGIWDVARPADDAFNDMGAFGMKTMAFEQWLRWVFVPRVEDALASNGPWPEASMVATKATREFDGWPEGEDLLAALRAFDACFPLGRANRARA